MDREISIRTSEYTEGSFDVVVQHNAEQFTVVPLTAGELRRLRDLMNSVLNSLPEIPWSDDDDTFNDAVSDRVSGRDRTK